MVLKSEMLLCTTLMTCDYRHSDDLSEGQAEPYASGALEAHKQACRFRHTHSERPLGVASVTARIATMACALPHILLTGWTTVVAKSIVRVSKFWISTSENCIKLLKCFYLVAI